MYFISHSTKDQQFIENELLPLLQALKVTSWYSKEDIKSGEQWERSIKNSLEECDWFILIMSLDSALSEWVKDELNWALENRIGKVIPIKIDNCKPEDFHVRLPRIQSIDFNVDKGVGRNTLISLLDTIKYKVNHRATTIKGSWTGSGHQQSGPNNEPVTYMSKIKVDVINQNEIKGLMTVKSEEFGVLYFTITGGFLFDHFFQFNYYSQDPAKIQFGAAVMVLNSAGHKMEGQFVGYGAYSNKIINGEFVFEKTP